MEIIRELEKKIKEVSIHISLARTTLDNLAEGKIKMSFMSEASTETSLENNIKLLKDYEEKLKDYKMGNLDSLMQQEREKQRKQKENYYKYQKIRLKRDKNRTDIEKNEAISLIDELPSGISIEDEDIFNIANKSNQLKLSLHWKIQNDLYEIRNKFKNLIKNTIDNANSELIVFEHIIPIIILQFYHLRINIEENIEEDKLKSFLGYPKFQQWLISELWNTPQAYFGLYKWKNIINYLCITSDQKRVLEKIFNNFIFIKKLIDDMGDVADDYNLAFDTLLKEYALLKEELNEDNLKSMKKAIDSLILKENFTDFNTKKRYNYLEFKRKKIDKKDKK